MILFVSRGFCFAHRHRFVHRNQRSRQQLDLPNGELFYQDSSGTTDGCGRTSLASLAEVVDQVQLTRGLQQFDRSHHQRNRCRGCGLKYNCDQSLDKAD